jgi:TRL (tRNA-associated locus)-like protein
MTRVLLAFVAVLASVVSGCAGPLGLIYTHTIQPLTRDFRQTPVVGDKATGDVKEIQYYVRVLWSGNGIGAIAKENGFDKVYYADLETLRVLGIWIQEWVHVYGTRAQG